MQYKDGKLYMKSSDVLALTGLTQGQLNNARQKNELETIQFADGGDCYYRPADVLEAHRQVIDEKRLGSTKLRKMPSITDADNYRSIISRLERSGYSVEDIRSLKTRGDGTYAVDYKPHLLPTDMPSDTEYDAGQTTAVETSEGEVEEVQVLKQPPQPDTLPFRFHMGNAGELPEHKVAATDFENVASGCFGYFDETNSECGENCKFSTACAALRFRILTVIGNGKDRGDDSETIREFEQSAREDFIQNIRSQL